MNEYLAVLRKYAVFHGRARRGEYWMFVLVNFLVVCALTLVEFMMGIAVGSPQSALTILYSLAVFLPALGVSVRRLHDTGRSGWWMLLCLLPILGGIIFIVFVAQRGQSGENRFGQDPKAPAAA